VRHRVFGRAGAGERVGVVEVRFLVVGSAVAASGRVEARIGAVHHPEEADSAVAVAVALGETKEEVGRIGLPVEARSTAAGLAVVGLSRVSRDGRGEWNTSSTISAFLRWCCSQLAFIRVCCPCYLRG
jgi:hypothetical protein